MYYRARYYDPSTSHFLSEDPMQFSAGNNFYEYSYNDPVRFSDPSGLQPAPNYVPPPPSFVVIPGGAAAGGAAIGGTEIGTGAAGGPIGALVAADLALGTYDYYQFQKLCVASGWSWCTPTPQNVSPNPAAATAATVADANNRAQRQCDKRNKKCPDCTPPVGTIAYDVHTDHTDFPFTDHWHLLVMSQNPNNCQCFWQRVGAGAGTPPSNAIPKP